MAGTIKGKALKVGDNINTDIISPPQYMELSVAEASKYAMSAVYPDFDKKVKGNPILVGGINFGSGSSRETSPLTLKYLGVQVIIAKFFARIFYRNAINVGIPVIECADTDKISENDCLEIDIEKGIVFNITKNEKYVCSKIPGHILDIIEQGGLVESLKNARNNG